jgi:alanine racemase
MAIVKADAYGHGAPWVARAALEAGATRLGVATIGEGEELRNHDVDAPIMVLGSITTGEVDRACRAGLEIAVGDLELLESVQRAVRTSSQPGPARVHLKIDTGMRRYGASLRDAHRLAEQISSDVHLQFAGIFTHFASADEPEDGFTGVQLDLFRQCVAMLANEGIPLPPLHVANSAGIFTGQGIDLNIVRLGIALYGIPPSNDVPLPAEMRPALRLESRIARIFPIDAGDTVGYNRTFRATSATRGALLPIGYADGYRRSLSGRAWVGLNGFRLPVLGRVSMDQTVVELPVGVLAKFGDAVTVMGDMTAGSPSVNELADLMATNTYEVLVGLRRRIPRVFTRNGCIVGVRTGQSDGSEQFPQLTATTPGL